MKIINLKWILSLGLLLICAQACQETPLSADAEIDDERSKGTSVDKFALWQEPAYFRGAAIHPYAPFGEEEEENRTYATRQDFQSLKDEGANTIILNYPGPFQVEAPYGTDEEALRYLDEAIDWAEEVGLYAIIHFRNGPGKHEDSFAGDPRRDETFWYSDEEQEKWVEMWQFVADRYEDRSHIVAYNLMVEPHPEDPAEQEPLEASVWNDLAKRITEAIREVDGQTPLIVSATVWSNPVAFADLEPTGDSKTIYSFHLYEPFQFTHQGMEWAGMEDVEDLTYPGLIPSDLFEETRYWDKSLIEEFLEPVKTFQQENNIPIFVGEFGCHRAIPTCVDYMSDLLTLFSELGWSHTFYIWGEDDGFDYRKGVSGSETIETSEYLEIFREDWSGNESFE